VTSSPQTYARVGGVLYLVIIAAGLVGELFVRGPLIVSGNAAATATHISQSASLWRAAIAGDLVMHVCDVGLMLVFFVLLSPVSRNLAALAVLFNLVQTAVLVANKMNLLIPLFLLSDADYLRAFAVEQKHALAYVFVRAHDYGFGIGLIFFGVECLIVGYLIGRSRYLPRALGVMMQIAGAAYLVNSFALIVYPPLASRLFPAILIPPFVAELSLALWLLVRGVDMTSWPARLENPS
jgi:Domain of unknown function (DUF4386)